MKNTTLASNRGNLELVETPLPQIDSHEVLIEVYYSAISIGTEGTIRKSTDLKSILKTAIKKADMIKELGIKKSIKTFKKVVEGYQLLGYSITGKVVAIGKEVAGIEKGDYVAACGAGRAIHAKYVSVPNIYVYKLNNMNPKYALAGVMTIGVNGVNKTGILVGDRICIIGGGLIGELTGICSKFAGLNAEIIEINQKVSKRLTEQGFKVRSSLEGEYDAIIICTDTTNTFKLAQEHIKFNGKIVITGYGELVLDRGLLESKQPIVTCVDSYGLGAGDYFYELNKGDILSKYNFNTARKNIQRTVYVLDNIKMPKCKILKIKDYKRIDSILASKEYATIILKWKNG